MFCCMSDRVSCIDLSSPDIPVVPGGAPSGESMSELSVLFCFWTQLYPILQRFSLNLELCASLFGQAIFPAFSLHFQIVFCSFFLSHLCLLSAIERGLNEM